MGLAAHLEGLMNGTFLMALGEVWTMVSLRYSSAVSDHGNRQQRPAVAGESRGDRVRTVGIAIVACSVLVLWGSVERCDASGRRM
jgi:hypothetical protein